MAGNITIGPKLAVDGEKEFKNAISGINKDMTVLGSEMKKVTAQFSDNKGSIESLTAQNEVLNKQIDTQKEKVDTLKKALENAKNEYGENSNKVKDWQIKLNNAEAGLSKLNNQVSNNEDAIKKAQNAMSDMSDSTDNYSESAGSAEKSTLSFADVLKANLLSNVIVGGIQSLASGLKDLGESTIGFVGDSQKAFNDLQAQTGATDDEMADLKDTMNQIYADNFGENIQDVADSMATVKQQTDLSGESLKDMTEQALLLRDTFDMDVSESVRSANMLMDTFGLTSEEAYNLIAQGAQDGLDKNGDLLDTINEYSTQFSSLGLSAEDMFNMLSNGADGGTFSVDKLGDAVKELSIRAKDGSDSTSDAFESLGLNVKDMSEAFAGGGDKAKEALQTVSEALFNIKDPVEQNRIGVELFGTQWEDLGSSGIEALTNLNGSISTTSDALNNINNTKYDDINSALDGLGRQIQTSIAEPLGEKIMPIVQDLITYVQENGPAIADIAGNIAEKVGDFVSWIVNHGSELLSTIAGIGTGLLTWNVISIISGLTKGMTLYQAATTLAATAQKLLNVALKDNPVGLVVTLIAGLVTAIITLWNTNEDFRKAVTEIMENIGEVVKKVVDAIGGFFTKTVPDAIGKMVDFFKNLPGQIKEHLDNTIGKVSTFATDLKNKALDAAKGMLSSIINGIKSLPGDIQEIGTNTVKGLWNGINSFGSWIGKNVKGLGSSIVKSLSSGITGLQDIGSNLVKGLWNGISDMAGWIGNKIKGFGSGVMDDLKDFFGIHSPSTKMRDEVGKYLAQGIGTGFVDEMSNITNDMNNSIPTDFEMSAAYSLSENATNTQSGFSDTYLESRIADVLKNIKLSGNVEVPVIIGTNEFGRAVVKVTASYDEIYNPA